MYQVQSPGVRGEVYQTLNPDSSQLSSVLFLPWENDDMDHGSIETELSTHSKAYLIVTSSPSTLES